MVMMMKMLMMVVMLTLYIVSFMRKYLKVEDKHWRPRMKILQKCYFMIKIITMIMIMVNDYDYDDNDHGHDHYYHRDHNY